MVSERNERDGLRAIFFERGERRQVRRGDVLHIAGDPVRHLYLLVEGWIGRIRANAAGETAFTALYIANDAVGVDAVAGGLLDDDIVALTDAVVLRVPRDVARAGIVADMDAAMVLVRLLTAETAFLREALMAVGRQSSTERLSTFVLQTYRRLIAAGLVAEGATRFELPLTQAQMAAVTGMTGVHVNRVLRLLRDGGCLDVRNGTARILDMALLERESRFGTLAPSRTMARASA